MKEMFAVALVGLLVGLLRKKKSVKMLAMTEKICDECLNKYPLNFEKCPKDNSRLIEFEPGARTSAKPTDIKALGWKYQDSGRIGNVRTFTATHRATGAILVVNQEVWSGEQSLEKLMDGFAKSIEATNSIKERFSGVTSDGIKNMHIFGEIEGIKVILSAKRYKDYKDGIIRSEIMSLRASSGSFKKLLGELIQINLFQCYDLKGKDIMYRRIK